MHRTKNLDDGYMGSGFLITRAVNTYKIDEFTKEILHVFDNEKDMISKEKELVTEEFCKREDTYNICPGGKGGFGYINSIGKNVTIQEQKKRNPGLQEKSNKASTKALSNRSTEEKKIHYEKISLALKGKQLFLGKTHTEDTKKKMSETAKKRLGDPTKNSQYGTMWITDGKETRKIKKDEFIPNGWVRGRTI